MDASVFRVVLNTSLKCSPTKTKGVFIWALLTGMAGLMRSRHTTKSFVKSLECSYERVGSVFRLNLFLYKWCLIAQFSAWCSLSTCSNLQPRSPTARGQWDLVQLNLKHMRSSSKARKYYTGLAATAHVRPDCRDCVVILPTVILESECTGKDRILITFF